MRGIQAIQSQGLFHIRGKVAGPRKGEEGGGNYFLFLHYFLCLNCMKVCCSFQELKTVYCILRLLYRSKSNKTSHIKNDGKNTMYNFTIRFNNTKLDRNNLLVIFLCFDYTPSRLDFLHMSNKTIITTIKYKIT